jgi:hypothetical protein
VDSNSCSITNPHGQGTPVDAIDRVCHEFQTCLSCLEYDRCNVDETIYAWQPVATESKRPSVFCQDANGSCERNLCHCEVDLAQRIVELANTFNPNYAHKYGFDRNKSCGKHGSLRTTRSTTTRSTTTTTTTTSTTTTTKTTAVERSLSNVRTRQFSLNNESDEDDYEAEEADVPQALDVQALRKILESDYPEDPLLSTQLPVVPEAESTTIEDNIHSEPMDDEPSEFFYERPPVVAKLESPVRLKSSQSQSPKSKVAHWSNSRKSERAPSALKCCGEYPNVQIFNPDRRKCCDGAIRSIGSC